MSAILISDHPFLNDTLKVNLQSCLSCKVVIIKDTKAFEQLVTLDQTYDFVLSLANIANKNIAKEVYQIHQKYIKNSPLLFLGPMEIVPPEAIHILDPFEVLNIIRTVANKLGWTAKDLVKRVTPDYIAVPIGLLMESPVAITDLYWKTESENEPYALIANENDEIKSKFEEWTKNQIPELFIKAEKRLIAMSSLNQSLVKSIHATLKNPQIEDIDKVQNAANMFSHYFNDPDSVELLSDTAKAKLGELAQDTAQLVGELTFKVPPSLSAMIEMFKKSPLDFIPRHSFLSTYFALQMIKNESWYSRQVNEKICMLLFFHDIILLPLFQKHKNLPESEIELLTCNQLTEKEKDVVRWHPLIVAQMLAKIPGIPVGMDQLIMQHHGSLNGDSAVKDMHEDVSILAKVAMVAESFATELLKSKSPLTQEAKDAISKKLRDKYKKRSYSKLLVYLENIEI
jgi:response regulator RpfG family c-di-GMP phosphodiesterase